MTSHRSEQHLDMERLRLLTLTRQLLVDRVDLDPVEATRCVGGLQAQHPASPYLALWNRVRDLDPGDVDRAFADDRLVKASLMRLTLHAVAADDLPAFRAAMEPSLRAAGFRDRRFTEIGLGADEGDAIVAEVARFAARPRTRAEVVSFVDDLRGTDTPSGLWRALRFVVPWRHSPTAATWSFADPAVFVATPEFAVDHADGVTALVRRYLEAFGPARPADIAQFTLLRQPVIAGALDRIEDLVSRPSEIGDLVDLHDAATEPDPGASSSVRLLPMWDNILLAYADRTRVVADEFRPHVIRRNGDVLASVLVGGRVVGVWRRVDAGIEICAFEDLAANRWEALEDEARALVGFLDRREPNPYGRYERWWERLPVDGRRTIVVD